MIRVNPLHHYLSLMRARGVADSDVLAGTSITDATLGDSGNLITLSEYQTIVDNMLRLAGDHGLGLDVGQHTELRHLGTLGYAALSCKTIRQSIELGAQYGNTFGFWGGMLPPRAEGELLAIDVLAPWQGHAAYRFALEAHLAFFLRVCQSTTGVDPEVEHLFLSFAEPDYSARYREIFHCPITFDAKQTRLLIKGNWLDAPLTTHNEELNRICKEHMDQLARQIEAGSPITMRLRDLLLQQSDGGFSLENIASGIGVSPRSLERQLKNEGHSFRKLVEEIRLQLAERWLECDLPPKQISHRLGFSDVNSFRRAFKGWTGKTIQEFRSIKRG